MLVNYCNWVLLKSLPYFPVEKAAVVSGQCESDGGGDAAADHLIPSARCCVNCAPTDYLCKHDLGGVIGHAINDVCS